MTDTPSPLESATTVELVDELGRRFPWVLVALLRPSDRDPEAEAFDLYHRGGFTAALGLAERSRAVLAHRSAVDVEDAEEGGSPGEG